MARSLDYPRWRYYTMQASMWLVLVASLGIAAMVSNLRQGRVDRIELGRAFDLDSVSVRLPAGWRMGRTSGGMLNAIEPVRPPWYRILVVDETEPNTGGLLGRLFGTSPSRPGRERADETVPMGPMTGKLTVIRDPTEFEVDGEEIARVEIRIVGELPSGRIVTVSMQSIDVGDEIDTADLELVKKVANSIELIQPSENGPQIRMP